MQYDGMTYRKSSTLSFHTYRTVIEKDARGEAIPDGYPVFYHKKSGKQIPVIYTGTNTGYQDKGNITRFFLCYDACVYTTSRRIK